MESTEGKPYAEFEGSRPNMNNPSLIDIPAGVVLVHGREAESWKTIRELSSGSTAVNVAGEHLLVIASAHDVRAKLEAAHAAWKAEQEAETDASD